VAADPLEALAGSLARVRHAIARIAEQRHAAERNYGAVVVSQVGLREMLREQRNYLHLSSAEIVRARDLARRAAENARVEGSDAAPYEQTATGLDRQVAVVDAACRQLADVDEAWLGNVARARTLLQESRARLDASLREQLELLARLERLDRDRRTARRYE
jgi:hypothetical protein